MTESELWYKNSVNEITEEFKRLKKEYSENKAKNTNPEDQTGCIYCEKEPFCEIKNSQKNRGRKCMHFKYWVL